MIGGTGLEVCGRYPGGDEPHEFRVIFVKIGLSTRTAQHIAQYQESDVNFPYHSTANQFFTADMFDAYTQLGFDSTERAFSNFDRPLTDTPPERFNFEVLDKKLDNVTERLKELVGRVEAVETWGERSSKPHQMGKLQSLIKELMTQTSQVVEALRELSWQSPESLSYPHYIEFRRLEYLLGRAHEHPAKNGDRAFERLHPVLTRCRSSVKDLQGTARSSALRSQLLSPDVVD